MTDDIVTRLRVYASVSVRIVANELTEAADEIERLRAELLKAQQGLGGFRRSRDRRDDEIERLRETIGQLNIAFWGQLKTCRCHDKAVRGKGRSDG